MKREDGLFAIAIRSDWRISVVLAAGSLFVGVVVVPVFFAGSPVLRPIGAVFTQKTNELILLNDELHLASFALNKPKFAFAISAHYKERLDEIRAMQKDFIKQEAAVTQ